MIPSLDGALGLLITLATLLFLQRRLHQEIQVIFFLLTRRLDITAVLFAVFFFPGVLIHEGSHFLAARLLGVPTGRFSLVPRPVGPDQLQLGYVETAPADWLRDALIGAAPLLSGGAFVAYAGLAQLWLLDLGQLLWQRGVPAFSQALGSFITQPDFWLWFYLALVVSSTMLPSKSDRRAWLPLSLLLLVIFSLSLIFGAGPWLLANMAAPFNRILQAIALVFAISALLHLILIPFIWLSRRLIGRLLKMDVML